MCCIWNITAEENQYVQFDLYDLHLEDKNDALKAYDGSCPSEEDNADTDLVKEFTGKSHCIYMNDCLELASTVNKVFTIIINLDSLISELTH